MANFNRYRVYSYSAPQYNWDARIDLYLDGTPQARLLFMRAGQALPANTSLGGVIALHYPMARLAEVMDLLRNEQPLFVTLNAANGIGSIGTGDEPVGEQEGH